MSVPPPHYLLFSQAQPRDTSERGRWHFVLQSLAGETELEAADHEAAPLERLELLAVVRGLEALEQPSRVTLVTTSKYVCHGMRFGVCEWRDNGFVWERFGRLAPIKHGDLWKRLDLALQIHEVDCRAWRLETNDDLANVPAEVASHRVYPGGMRNGDEPRRSPTKKRLLRLDPSHTSAEGPAKTESENTFLAAWEWFARLWRQNPPSSPLKAGSRRSSSPPAPRPSRRRPLPR